MRKAMSIQYKQLYLHQRPIGNTTDDDVRMRTVDVDELADGQLLIKNDYFSLDPAIRGWMSAEPNYMPPIGLGEVVRSSTVGTVVESKHSDFAVGDQVYGLNGWEEYSLSDGYFLTKVPADNKFPLHYYLSIFGAVGLTAYFGITDSAELKAGDTLLMSAAAGAVGSLGGQLAKNMGCRVVGLAGTDEKCQWLKDELGFDGVINYKTESGNLEAAIRAECPDGVDVFFDNVGGETLDAALLNLRDNARIVFCGSISSYNASEPVPGPYNYWQILAKNAVVKGFLVSAYFDRFEYGAAALAELLVDEKIDFKYQIVEGFDNTLSAFHKLFDGSNTGKLMLKV
jgi:NADPH-dependent curcumin reductase CurA